MGAVDFEASSFGGNEGIALNEVDSCIGRVSEGTATARYVCAAWSDKLPKADVVDLKVLVETGGLMKMGKLPSRRR